MSHLSEVTREQVHIERSPAGVSKVYTNCRSRHLAGHTHLQVVGVGRAKLMISSGTMPPPVLRGASETFTVLFCGHEFEVGWRATVESLASSGSTVQVSSDSHHSKV